MLIALLALLGIDLVVIVVLAALAVGRRRWLKRQPGAFFGAVRVLHGEVDGLRVKWRPGCGRWVREVLVWEKGPFMFRTVLVPVDARAGDRTARPGEVKRLGEDPTVTELQVGSSRIEVATRPEHRALVVDGLSPRATTGPPG